MNENNKSFNYSYSSTQQEEIQNIRKKYLPKEEDKMETLKKLDESVTRKSCTASLSLGIISTLIMGVGMCCVMVWDMFAIGIIVGIIGMIGVILAYPLYKRITKKQREKIAPIILRLTEELMNK